MPQIFCAVQCYECKTFQVQQEKKKPQFKCAVCGTQQAMQRIYAKSSKARDCREVVMTYNAAKGEIEDDLLFDQTEPVHQEAQDEYVQPTATGKWMHYAEEQVRKLLRPVSAYFFKSCY